MNNININKIPDIETMRKIVKHLQSVLRIQDWDIDVKYITALEMTKAMGEYTLAYIHRLKDSYDANIYLCDEPDLIECDCEKDWYKTIVHELLHIVTDCMFTSDDDKPHYQEERTVEKLAKIFTSIYTKEDACLKI